MNTKAFIFSVAIAVSNLTWAGDYEDGLVAYLLKDYKTAFTKFQIAAKQGNPKAQAELGFMYSNGEGVVQDHKEAARWYTLAAQQGNPDAQYNLGFMYSNGEGVVQDYKEAVRWYTLAARQGNAVGQLNLGFMYSTGRGVLQDFNRGHMWLNIAAIGGDKVSIKNRDIVASLMTPEQIEQAQRMARECLNSKFKNCD